MSFTRLYLGRLAPDTRREDIEDFFKGYGVSSFKQFIQDYGQHAAIWMHPSISTAFCWSSRSVEFIKLILFSLLTLSPSPLTSASMTFVWWMDSDSVNSRTLAMLRMFKRWVSRKVGRCGSCLNFKSSFDSRERDWKKNLKARKDRESQELSKEDIHPASLIRWIYAVHYLLFQDFNGRSFMGDRWVINRDSISSHEGFPSDLICLPLPLPTSVLWWKLLRVLLVVVNLTLVGLLREEVEILTMVVEEVDLAGTAVDTEVLVVGSEGREVDMELLDRLQDLEEVSFDERIS